MRPNRLNSRASSATLSLRRQQDVATLFADDSSITQNLLRGQVIPMRRTSIRALPSDPNISLALAGDGPSIADEPSDVVQRPRIRRGLCSSNTWTSSSAEGESENDDLDDRTHFIEEFNRLADKHGVRKFIPSEYEDVPCIEDGPDKHGNWLSRKLFRRTSSSQTPVVKSKKAERRDLKKMRSISDSLRLKSRRDSLKDRDLVELVRLCGSSLLYLPAEYAASSLTLPTCIRATAQYLIQHAPTTRGVFRIPGSQHTINLIYEHYCSKGDQGHIAGTVRCPTLPDHMECDVHDVASAFKRFLSGIPGGILGSLPLFDALVSIQTHLRGDPEMTRTKHSKVRARLIALSISTLRSTYRRELICAVLGLLCMVGRAAETARREDDRGRPLPTSDLMGYKPLGIVFGPLLVGDLMDNYNIRLANGHGSLVLTPLSPPKTKKERKKYKSAEEGVNFNNLVDKIKVAGEITEMLITHWRDVVRHMKNLEALASVEGSKITGARGRKPPILRPSMSESFSLRRPPDWTSDKPNRNADRSQSPTPPRRRTSPRSCPRHSSGDTTEQRAIEQQALDYYTNPLQFDALPVTKQRLRQRLSPGEALKNAKSSSALSTVLVKEHPDENDFQDSELNFKQTPQSIVPSSSTRNGKENNQKHPAVEHTTERHVKGIVRRLESESIEAEESLPVRYYENLRHDTTLDAQSNPLSLDAHSKKIETTSSSSLLQDSDQKHMQVSAPSHHDTPSNRESHIRFAPSTSNAQDAKDFRRRQGFTGSDYSKGNSPKDPLSQVSHEDDLASLAVLGQALESPGMSMKSEVKSIKSTEKSDDPTKNDSGIDFHEKREAEKPVKKPSTPSFLRPHLSRQNPPDTPKSAKVHVHDDRFGIKSNIPRKTDSAASVITTLVEPKAIQAKGRPSHETASPATLSKVASIREMFRKRKSDSRSSKSIEDNHKSEPSRPVTEHHTEPHSRKIPTPEPTRTPKKVSVRAMAEKFDTVKATPPLSSSAPVKSTIPTPITSVDNRRGVGVISPYTINPPPSPTRSIASFKSGKSIRSFRNTGLAQRFQQAQEQSSPTKMQAPKRVLRDFVPEPIPPQVIVENSHEDSVASLRRPLSTSNSLTVPLKPVGHQSPMPIRQAGMDGAYSSIGNSDIMSLTSSEFEAAHTFLQSQSQLAHNATLSKDTLTRGNTVLHSQIRKLQQQVYEKTEQVRQLQRRFEIRSSSDTEHIGLTEQLRESREEVEMWRRRAEAAERKLELMDIIRARNDSRMEEQRGLIYQAKSVQAEDDIASHGRGYSVDDGTRRLVLRRRMTGTMSSEDSAGSNGTIVRERSGRYEDGSEICMDVNTDGVKHKDWANQTLSILDGFKSWEN
ncbi:uncharacterized protein EAE97_008840 [Botrytis byssoidea]|uniref:Rho-GAP domain-containing protein n=1 Tax=Botrytis byssoidea TaxID=139641 RepID=A0A9P5I973_9HELO|nr:uncharacterized protein EAE97_008840 [Botrytis byssoidea]KAF7933073.1 hypothetical protein EAE97_008840 [Botrytis byssoidea]